MNNTYTHYQQLFTLEYLKSQNPGDAARASGYLGGNPVDEGKRLLTLPNVQSAIRKHMDQLVEAWQ